MEPCTFETGLLRKKPCGHASVTNCVNCERPLCSQHAVAQMNAAGHKSGKFLCKECQAAWKDIEKNTPSTPVAKPAEKPADKAAHTPAAPAPAKAAAARAKAAPAQAKTEPAKPAEAEKPPEKPADSGMIEFTPTKKP